MSDIQSLRRVVTARGGRKELFVRDGAKIKAADRRQYLRYHYMTEGTASLFSRTGHGDPPPQEPQTIPPPKRFPVVAVSLSRSGLGFLANYNLQVGDMVHLSLPTKTGDRKDLYVKTVRAKRVGLNAFEFGCEFVDPE